MKRRTTLAPAVAAGRLLAAVGFNALPGLRRSEEAGKGFAM